MKFCAILCNFCRFLRLIGVIVTLALKRQLFTLIFAVLLSLFFSFRMMSRLISFSNSTQKTSIRRKDLGDLYMLSYSLFCVRFVWHHSIARPENPLQCWRISGISPTQAELVPILSQIALPRQQESVVVEFVWRHSIPWPRKLSRISEISVIQAVL